MCPCVADPGRGGARRPGEALRGSSRDGSQIGPIVRPARPLHVSKPIVVVDFYSYYATHNSDVLISFNRTGMPKRASS